MTGQDWTEVIGAFGVFALTTTVVTVVIPEQASAAEASRES